MQTNNALYSHNPSYSWSNSENNDKSYFLHQDGYGIRTDKLVGLIWRESNDRLFNQIYQAVNRKKLVSTYFLQLTLDLMVKSGLLRKSDDLKPAAVNKTDVKGLIRESEQLVSIIIVNYNGRSHLQELLTSISDQSYPKVETIVVDNASSDDSVSYIQKNWPQVKLIEQSKNLGFAGGNNVGIKSAEGEYIFLLNSDTKMDPDCLAYLVSVAERSPEAAAIVPKIKFFSMPNFINAIGNSIGLVGWGSDNYIGYLDLGQFDEIEEVFSACFAATLIRRKALDRIGLLDEAYKFYYEDSDWSYRARLLGHKILFASDAVVYHKFNATMNTLPNEFKLRLIIGNRIRFTLKNLRLKKAIYFTWRYIKEDLRNFLSLLRRSQFRLAYTYISAWTRLTIMLFEIFWSRRKIQRERLPEISDNQLLRLAKIDALLDENGYPILSVQSIRRVYMHQL